MLVCVSRLAVGVLKFGSLPLIIPKTSISYTHKQCNNNDKDVNEVLVLFIFCLAAPCLGGLKSGSKSKLKDLRH
jgi:hypothetical protein